MREVNIQEDLRSLDIEFINKFQIWQIHHHLEDQCGTRLRLKFY